MPDLRVWQMKNSVSPRAAAWEKAALGEEFGVMGTW